MLDTDSNLVGPPGPEGPPGPPGGGGSTDTIPPALPTGLELTTGTVLQDDGTVRPFLQGRWDDPVDADFDNFGVFLTPATIARPGHGTGVGWSLEARAGASTLPPGGYTVGVTAYGVDGGQSSGFIENMAIAAGSSSGPTTYPYNDPIFTRTHIAIANYAGGFYPETTDVYETGAFTLIAFDVVGPTDLVFRSYGGAARVYVDGVQGVDVGPSAPGKENLKLTPVSIRARA